MLGLAMLFFAANTRTDMLTNAAGTPVNISATWIARESTMSAAADATATAQARPQQSTADAQWTALAQAVGDTASADGTRAALESQMTALAQTNAQSASQIEVAASREADAKANIAYLLSTQTALHAEATAAVETIAAQSVEIEAVGLTQTAAASRAQNSDASAVAAINAAATGRAELVDAKGEAAAAGGTAEALLSERAAILATATVLAIPTNTPEPLPTPTFVTLDRMYKIESIQVDWQSLLSGNEAAIADARAKLRQKLNPYQEARCRVGLVQTFGHGRVSETEDRGAALAAAINEILFADFPELFENAVSDQFIDRSDPVGQVDVRLYFFGPCDPSS